MARYIDADKALEFIKETNANYHWLLAQYNAQWVYDFIESQPTADVVPKSEVAREIFAEIESKIKNDIDDITESINHIIDPDAIDGQYEEIATLEWVLDSIAELKMKYTEDQT